MVICHYFLAEICFVYGLCKLNPHRFSLQRRKSSPKEVWVMAPKDFLHYSVPSWVEENKKFFLPPVCNKMMYVTHTLSVSDPPPSLTCVLKENKTNVKEECRTTPLKTCLNENGKENL